MVSIAFAVRAVESVVFGSTTLTLAERVIALLPDAALTSPEDDEVEEEEEEEEEEELSSLFAQPRRIRLIVPSITSKLIVLFIILPCLMNKSRNVGVHNPYRVNYKSL